MSDSLESSVGSTFSRDSFEGEGFMINFAYIDTDTYYPIEYSIGFIEGADNKQDPKSDDFGYVAIGARRYWNNLFLGLGGALVSDTNDRLSSTFNFKPQIGYHYKSLIFKVEHLSNAGIGGENKGESFFYYRLR